MAQNFLEIRPKVKPQQETPSRDEELNRRILIHYNLIRSGNIEDILNAALQAVWEDLLQIVEFEKKHSEPIEDTALESDRQILLHQCQKCTNKTMSAVKFLSKAFNTMRTEDLIQKGFKGFYQRLGQANLDLAMAQIKNVLKVGRRVKIGPELDNEFRELEQDRITKSQLEKELEDTKLAFKKMQEIAAASHGVIPVRTFTAADVARATNLGSARAATHHLQRLCARGRIAPKAGNWELSFIDYTTAVSYINGSVRSTKR